jgi:hypothetical protein
MNRKLKTWGAGALFLMVVAAGLGFAVIAAAMGAVIGGLLMLGVRLAEGASLAGNPAATEPPADGTAEPA